MAYRAEVVFAAPISEHERKHYTIAYEKCYNSRRTKKKELSTFSRKGTLRGILRSLTIITEAKCSQRVQHLFACEVASGARVDLCWIRAVGRHGGRSDTLTPECYGCIEKNETRLSTRQRERKKLNLESLGSVVPAFLLFHLLHSNCRQV